MHTIEYYLAFKKKEIMLFVTTRVNMWGIPSKGLCVQLISQIWVPHPTHV